jgi:hypothetical protein
MNFRIQLNKCKKMSAAWAALLLIGITAPAYSCDIGKVKLDQVEKARKATSAPIRAWMASETKKDFDAVDRITLHIMDGMSGVVSAEAEAFVEMTFLTSMAYDKRDAAMLRRSAQDKYTFLLKRIDLSTEIMQEMRETARHPEARRLASDFIESLHNLKRLLNACT